MPSNNAVRPFEPENRASGEQAVPQTFLLNSDLTRTIITSS